MCRQNRLLSSLLKSCHNLFSHGPSGLCAFSSLRDAKLLLILVAHERDIREAL
jgi:hypothetical protein